MATTIIMPAFGTTVEEVKLVRWLKAVGDSVNRGDILCEVETDKATSELESIAKGILLQQVVPEGAEVEQGTIIAYVGASGEVPPVTEGPKPIVACPQPSSAPPSPPKFVARAGGVQASPVIRNLAQREGVDLADVVGTGPGGRITRDDVLRTKQTSTSASKLGVPYSKEQLSVARRVSRSNREIPTVDLMASIDMSAVIHTRKRLIEQSARKVAYDSFFLHGVAQSIKQFPSFAGHANDDLLYKHETIDVCLAISHEKRLYLPAVRKADTLTLDEIQAEIESLVKKTRVGHLASADLAGGCFTVSNLGMYPIDAFQMIIPPEQSAAMAIGATEQRPVVKDDQIIVRPMCTVALSVDHRMINGAEAAEFLKHLKEVLETL